MLEAGPTGSTTTSHHHLVGTMVSCWSVALSAVLTAALTGQLEAFVPIAKPLSQSTRLQVSIELDSSSPPAGMGARIDIEGADCSN